MDREKSGTDPMGIYAKMGRVSWHQVRWGRMMGAAEAARGCFEADLMRWWVTAPMACLGLAVVCRIQKLAMETVDDLYTRVNGPCCDFF